MSIRVTTLGAVQVVRGDSVLAALPAQRLRCALLVYMAVTRTAPRDRLLALFWPERTEDRARHALSQTIYELRRSLGDDWIDVRGEQLLVASHISVDLAAFEESVERGDYGAALAMYRGSFLDGFYLPGVPSFEGWVDTLRQRAQRHHRRARREWIRYLVDQARLKDALTAARDWTALDPDDDEAQHRLIELLAETGDRAGAIGQYELYQRMLAAEELEPLEDTRALVDRIRAGAVGALPATSAVHASATAAPPPGRTVPRPTAAAEPPSTQPPAVEPPVPTMEPPARRMLAVPGSRRLLAIGLAGSAVVALLFALTRLRQPEPVAAATPHRIAVLYFDDRSPPPGAPHLAAGVTERLIEAFSGLNPQLTVRSKHVVAPFRDRAVPWDSLARALEVDLFVSGSVVQDAGRVRVGVQLVDPVTGVVEMTREVNRPDGRYLELLDDVVDTVSLLLRRRIGAQLEAERLRMSAPSDDAWLTLRLGIEAGGAALGKVRDGVDVVRDEFARADTLLARAERFDRRWSEPTMQRATLAMQLAGVEIHFKTQRGRLWMDTALAHAERSLKQSRSAAALELRGTILSRTASFTGTESAEAAALLNRAEADLREATNRDPSRAQALAQLAWVLWSRADFQQANRYARQAKEIDAFLGSSLENLYIIGATAFELGNEAEAAQACHEGLRRYRDARFTYCILSIMAWSDRAPARPDSAWKLVDAFAPLTGPSRLEHRPMLEMLVAGTLVRANLRDSARAVLRRAAEQPSSSAATAWMEAAVLGRLGETAEATRLLRQLFAEDSVLMRPVARGRALAPLLADPAILRALRPGDR